MINYKSKITFRTKNTFCVHFPKKLINSKDFFLGDNVKVTIEKVGDI